MKTHIVLFEIFPNLNNKINIFESILSTHISARIFMLSDYNARLLASLQYIQYYYYL